MADDLYDVDFVAWTEAQAAALRARRSGANALDYDNLAEEIEDLGKSEQYSCESYVENIIEHMLKIEFARTAETLPHWRGEVVAFRSNLERRLTRTIEHRIQERLAKLFANAKRSIVVRDLPVAALPDVLPYTWEQIVDTDWYP